MRKKIFLLVFMLTMVFLNAHKNHDVIPVDMTDYRINYFMGNDRTRWKKNIPSSKAVLYRDLYTSIDLKVYGLENHIEYDYIVKPGGDVENIKFEYSNIITSKIDTHFIIQRFSLTRKCLIWYK